MDIGIHLNQLHFFRELLHRPAEHRGVEQSSTSPLSEFKQFAQLTPAVNPAKSGLLASKVQVQRRQSLRNSTGRIATLLQTPAVLTLFGFMSGGALLAAMTTENPTGLSTYLAGCGALLGSIIAVEAILSFLETSATEVIATSQAVTVSRRGFSPRQAALPISQIQQLSVDTDFLGAILGLYDLSIRTKTDTATPTFKISGLDRKGAIELRHKVIKAYQSINARVQKAA